MLIVCPLPKELKLLLQSLAQLKLTAELDTAFKIPTYRIPEKKWILAQGGHGKAQFAVQCQYLLSQIGSVEALICAGSAGGLASEVQTGDLVIAEKTIEHDFKQKFFFKEGSNHFLGNAELLQKSKNFKGTDFFVHFGAIASGDEDIVDTTRATELYRDTKAMAVAWEGSGGARVARFNEIPFLEVRAITDNAKNSVSESFAANLGLAMKNAADFFSRTF